jgi:predicted permease
MRNVKLAARSLAKTPFVTAVAVLSLALGIGANAAIFSMVHQILLRPLPVAEPDRLVNLSAPGPKPGSQSCNQAGDCNAVFSYAMFRDLEQAETGFSGIAAHVSFGANLAVRQQTASAQGMLVSGSYFPLLGLRPAAGRLFGPGDDEVIGGHYVVVLGHDYWVSRLDSDPSVVGDVITVNGHPMEIVGVAPEGFTGTTLGVRPAVYVPLSMRGVTNPGFDAFENRRSYWAYLFARLGPGVTIDQAAASVNSAYRTIVNEVEAPLQTGMSEQAMERFRTKEIELEPGARGQSQTHEGARVPLILLFSITGIVLLIACANIANLLLARAATRGLEMAVRLSLGASRIRVVTQLLTEALLLAVLGGAASLLVAHWTLAGMEAMLPARESADFFFRLDTTVILFAAALSVGTGVLFGLFPALHSTRPDLMTILRANSGQPSGARAAQRFRTSLVTVQIALSMALLISAGLFLKSLVNVTRVDLGIRTENVVTFGVAPVLNGYEPERTRALFEEIEAELAAIPGVTGVSAALVAVLAGNSWGTDVNVQGFESGPDIDSNSRMNQVGPDYFGTLGMPLLAGREFTAADVAGAPGVAIVNEAFARKFGLGRDAVGSFMSPSGSEAPDLEIVGLVRDASYSEVKTEVPPLFFTPWRQNESIGWINFYVRTAGDPAQILTMAPEVVRRLDPNLPVDDLKTLTSQVRESIFMDRMIGTLSAAFAVLATVLAAIGLYGVLAYTVAQRTREIGVRMALGANARRVRLLVLRQVGVMVLIGGTIGLAAAYGLGRVAQSLLFELEGHDPGVMMSAALLLTLVAAGAGYVPALRASRVDPMEALRYE